MNWKFWKKKPKEKMSKKHMKGAFRYKEDGITKEYLDWNLISCLQNSRDVSWISITSSEKEGIHGIKGQTKKKS